MAAYKRTDKKGWYISFYFKNRKIKLMNWKAITGINKPFDTKTEAQTAEAKYRLLLENPTATITLYDLYDEYVMNTKSTLKESSLKRYNVFRRNYLTLIKNKLIYNLEPKEIIKWKNEVIKLNITSQSKNMIKNIMLELLKYGSQMYELKGKLQLPLLENLKDNSVPNETKEKYITPSDFELILKPLKDYLGYYNNLYYYTILKVLYNTGLRVGELAALTIDDFKNDYIIINKDYARVNGKDIIQSTKSKNSIRKVYLDNSTKELLQYYISTKKPDVIIFHLERNFLTQQRLREVFHKLCVISGLDKKYECKIHNLRHSHASNLRQLGFDEVAISKRLGNTPDVAITTYIHTQDDENVKIAQKLNDLVPN